MIGTDFTGIVLAGGKSSRFGENKALAHFRNKNLLEHSISLLRHFCSEIIISAGNQDYEELGFKVVRDEIPDIGPIGGIYSTLKVSKNKYNLVLACDVPYASKSLFEQIIKKHENHTAVIPVHNRKIEPLIACYSKDILPFLTQNINKQNYKLRDVLSEAGVFYLDVSNIKSDNFININTQADIENLIISVHP